MKTSHPSLGRCASVLLGAALFLTACGTGESHAKPGPTKPGHDGAVPSVDAQRVLVELKGAELVLSDEKSLRLGDFGVVPNPVTGKGPVMQLGDSYLPLETDGDVADLYRRIRGEKHAQLEGSLSDAYRSALEALENPEEEGS